MTIVQLLERAGRHPIFTLEDCRKWFPQSARATIIVQLSHHVAHGHFLRLKPGLFLLNREPFPDPRVIASRLDSGSIISIETVLRESNMIPEIPFATTAVTSGKTSRYTIPGLGTFLFRHIKSSLVFGWTTQSFPPYSVRIATPEKALLDLLWFHRFERDLPGYLHELRLTIPPTFSWKRFREYDSAYNIPQFQTVSREAEKTLRA
ncbi:MAG: hypothetical protein Q7S48_01920 [bacterium]|nr:hypothetical protein [bacterium]